MTFSDDEIRLQFEGGFLTVTCIDLGIDWPPPERLAVFGFDMHLHRCSAITDEQRALLHNVVRGAEYVVEKRKEH